jgi:hypothetical protein
MSRTATKLSVSVPTILYERATRLLGKPDSALITRLLKDAVRAAEDADIDAQYERAIAAHPDYLSSDAQARASAMARQAYGSAHRNLRSEQSVGQRD